MAKRTLTTPIPVPNITKVEIVDVNDKRDAATDPHYALTLHFEGVGARDAGTHTITARDALNSNPIALNATPAGYGDMIVSGGVAQCDGACTALATSYDTAFDAATGTRTAKRRAGEAAALVKAQEIGLVGAGLAST
jgi:hypothetical protein